MCSESLAVECAVCDGGRIVAISVGCTLVGPCELLRLPAGTIAIPLFTADSSMMTWCAELRLWCGLIVATSSVVPDSDVARPLDSERESGAVVSDSCVAPVTVFLCVPDDSATSGTTNGSSIGSIDASAGVAIVYAWSVSESAFLVVVGVILPVLVSDVPADDGSLSDSVVSTAIVAV